MNDIIRFEQVTKAYGDQVILKAFDLKIRKGEFLTVIGSSGSGKTTMLKLINGLSAPTQGKIYIDGKDISQENQTLLRRNIGYVIQGIGLFPHMTVRKNIAYVPSLLNQHDKERTRKAVERLIGVVGLEQEMLDRYPSELSGGQRQRVGIARTVRSRRRNHPKNVAGRNYPYSPRTGSDHRFYHTRYPGSTDTRNPRHSYERRAYRTRRNTGRNLYPPETESVKQLIMD